MDIDRIRKKEEVILKFDKYIDEAIVNSVLDEETKKGKMRMTTGSLEKLLKMTNDYFYSTTFKFEQDIDGTWKVFNSKGEVKDFFVRKKGKKYQFVELNK